MMSVVMSLYCNFLDYDFTCFRSLFYSIQNILKVFMPQYSSEVCPLVFAPPFCFHFQKLQAKVLARIQNYCSRHPFHNMTVICMEEIYAQQAPLNLCI